MIIWTWAKADKCALTFVLEVANPGIMIWTVTNISYEPMGGHSLYQLSQVHGVKVIQRSAHPSASQQKLFLCVLSDINSNSAQILRVINGVWLYSWFLNNIGDP